jgi:hypothetical protein
LGRSDAKSAKKAKPAEIGAERLWLLNISDAILAFFEKTAKLASERHGQTQEKNQRYR